MISTGTQGLREGLEDLSFQQDFYYNLAQPAEPEMPSASQYLWLKAISTAAEYRCTRRVNGKGMHAGVRLKYDL